jgi:hypothetical protein
MGQLRQGSARTTAAVRRAIQHSQESIAKLAARYDLNPKTIAKWKNRASIHDAPMGPKQPHSTVLTKDEEALIMTFRRHMLLPLDDCLYALQSTIPYLTLSALLHCLKRHAISRLPEIEGDKPQKKQFKPYPIGYFHIDMAEVRSAEGKLSLLVPLAARRSSHLPSAIPRPSRRWRHSSCAISWLLYLDKLHTVLTAHGLPFTHQQQDTYAFQCIFARVCEEHAIAHRLTTTQHPWTNGQGERMHRTLTAATVKTDYNQTHQHLEAHLHALLMADNFAKRLKTLRGLTAYDISVNAGRKSQNVLPESRTSTPWD